MDKKKLARKMRTKEEIKKKVPIFLTKAWELRREGIAKGIKNKIENRAR